MDGSKRKGRNETLKEKVVVTGAASYPVLKGNRKRLSMQVDPIEARCKNLCP
jgi:hypothetical protein